MAKVTYVHFGANEDEMGIQFDPEDWSGAAVEGRLFAPLPPALKETVLAAAQAELDAQMDTLPVDLPPSAVTTALMKRRTAEQAAASAEAKCQAAVEERARIEAENIAKRAELEALDAAIAAKRAATDAGA